MRVLRYRGRNITAVRPVECPKCTSLEVSPSRFREDRFFCIDCLHNFTKVGRNPIPDVTDKPRFAVFHVAFDADGATSEITEIAQFDTIKDAETLLERHRQVATEWEYDVAERRWHFRVDHGPATSAGRYAWQDYYALYIGKPQ